MSRVLRVPVMVLLTLVPSIATAQINFEKTAYYAALVDSLAAGE